MEYSFYLHDNTYSTENELKALSNELSTYGIIINHITKINDKHHLKIDKIVMPYKNYRLSWLDYLLKDRISLEDKENLNNEEITNYNEYIDDKHIIFTIEFKNLNFDFYNMLIKQVGINTENIIKINHNAFEIIVPFKDLLYDILQEINFDIFYSVFIKD